MVQVCLDSVLISLSLPIIKYLYFSCPHFCMAVNRDKVVQFIRIRGPVIPAEIKKEVGTDIIFASAILSELVDSKALKLSHLKIGGSPLYYAPGQEYRLQNFAGKLNEKDQKTYELLKSKILLRDKELDPLTRVSLRQIKDFAVPLDVQTPAGTEIFWKWYLTPTADLHERIKTAIGFKDKTVVQALPVSEPLPQPAARESEPAPQKAAQQHIHAAQQAVVTKPLHTVQPPSQTHLPPRHMQQKLDTVHHHVSQTNKQEQAVRHEPPIKQEQEDKQEAGKKSFEKELSDFKKEVVAQVRKEMALQKPDVKAKEIPKKQEPQRPLADDTPLTDSDDRLFRKAKKYFDESRIVIKSAKINRKNSDIDFVIEVPSSVGRLVYYCKAKDKKKINEGDLSALFMDSQRRKMPVLFLVTGELTKKAQQLLDSEFKSMNVKKV